MITIGRDSIYGSGSERAQEQASNFLLGLGIITQMLGQFLDHLGRKIAQPVQKAIPGWHQGTGSGHAGILLCNCPSIWQEGHAATFPSALTGKASK
jgi:hypothetical protein